MQVAIHGRSVIILFHRRSAFQICYVLLLELDNLQERLIDSARVLACAGDAGIKSPYVQATPASTSGCRTCTPGLARA